MANIDATLWANFMTGAYDKFARYQLRSRPMWRQFVDVHPVDPTIDTAPSYTINLAQEFTGLSTTPLTDGVDPAAVAPPAPLQVTVSVAEYGMPSVLTLKVRDLAYVQVDPVRANLVGKNMFDSVDKLVQNVVDTGTNGIQNAAGVWSLGGPAAVTAADTSALNSQGIRIAGSLLNRRNVSGFDAMDNFVGLAHPDVINDILADAGWLAPHQYQDTENVYNREIGRYLGIRWIQGGANRITTATDGAAAAKVYRTYVLGREAMVGASVHEPGLVVGPQVDSLRRNFPLGWFGLFGFAKFRDEAIQKIYTSSTLRTF